MLYDLLGEWDKALATIQQQLDAIGIERHYLRWQRYFYSNGFDYKRLRESWLRYEKASINDYSYEELYPIARAFWMNNDSEKSIEVLKKVSTTSIAKHPEEYWELYLNLARRANLPKQQLYAYQQLQTVRPLGIADIYWYAKQNFASNTQAKLAWLWAQYDEHNDEDVLAYIAGLIIAWRLVVAMLKRPKLWIVGTKCKLHFLPTLPSHPHTWQM